MRQSFTGAAIFDGTRLHHGETLVVDDGRVLGLGAATGSDVALDGGILAPGLIDLQVNGGGGVAVDGTTDVAALAAICAAHSRLGVTGLLPTLITENLGSSDRDAMLNEILDLNHQSLKLGDQLGPEVHRVLVRSTERIRIGGSLREQLFGLRELRDDNDELRKLLGKQQQKAAADSSFEAASSATVMFMADQLVQAGRSGQTAERTRQLMDLISRRNALIQRVNRDIQLHARMRVWLHLHIPLTVALLVALVAHVLSVFLYW